MDPHIEHAPMPSPGPGAGQGQNSSQEAEASCLCWDSWPGEMVCSIVFNFT